MKIGSTVKFVFGLANSDLSFAEGEVVVVTARNGEFIDDALRAKAAVLVPTEKDKIEIPKLEKVVVENVDILPDTAPRRRGRKRDTESAGGV